MDRRQRYGEARRAMRRRGRSVVAVLLSGALLGGGLWGLLNRAPDDAAQVTLAQDAQRAPSPTGGTPPGVAPTPTLASTGASPSVGPSAGTGTGTATRGASPTRVAGSKRASTPAGGSRGVSAPGPGTGAVSAADTSVATPYFVDCTGGDDAADGRSTGTAWRSLGKAAARSYRAGEGILLRRGCSWGEGLVVRGSGSAQAPIVVSAYGSGARPRVSNGSGDQYATGIGVSADHVVVDGLEIADVRFAGVQIHGGQVVVQNNEIHDAGFGVAIEGDDARVISNDVHDLHMIVNTPGGSDDYGAVGFRIVARRAELAGNRCTNCRASSNDFGVDGGFAEIWNEGDDTVIHHNIAVRSDGFLEVGAEEGGDDAANVRVAYNLIDNTGYSININRQNAFAIGISGFLFENNTIVQNGGDKPQIMFPDASPDQFLSRNNIFYLVGATVWVWYGGGAVTHFHNLYYLGDRANLGFALGGGEREGDPGFRDPAAGDYRPARGGPADGMGVSLGYARDLAGAGVGSPPAVGAYEP